MNLIAFIEIFYLIIYHSVYLPLVLLLICLFSKWMKDEGYVAVICAILYGHDDDEKEKARRVELLERLHEVSYFQQSINKSINLC